MSSRFVRCVVVLAVLGAALPPLPSAASPDEAIAAADAAWARRSEGHEGARARPEAARRAVEAAEAAAQAHPESLAARWRLLRALFFEGEFAAGGEAARRDAFDRAADVAEASLERLAARLPGGRGLRERLPDAEGAEVTDGAALRRALEEAGEDPDDAARLHFWAGIAWGGWSRVHGLLDAVREGVAGRIHGHARVAASLDPTVDRGGPFRLLARLHADLPRVPFLSGWVDRGRALPLAERAREVAPEFPGNRLTFALTLLDVAPERREEARRLLEEVAALEPSGEDAVELASMRESARERLADLSR